jgi:hypothetical protein
MNIRNYLTGKEFYHYINNEISNFDITNICAIIGRISKLNKFGSPNRTHLPLKRAILLDETSHRSDLGRFFLLTSKEQNNAEVRINHNPSNTR